MSDNQSWAAIFKEVGRRRIGGGPKTRGAEEITWRGELGHQVIDCISRVRLVNPMESFLTSSNHRLRDSHVGRAGHWVDMRVTSDVDDDTLAWIQRLAQATDDRPVFVTRGKHGPARPYDEGKSGPFAPGRPWFPS